MKVVIVGGVAGGASAAARIRRRDETAEIVMFEKTGYISYANCGLPYYIGGSIADEEDLTLQTPESFRQRFRVDVRVLHEVTAIHPEKKTVSVTDLRTGKQSEESYDKLLLSTGAKPTRPPFPGLDNDRVFTLRTVEDTLAIKAFIDRKKPRRAVVIGGGFIGLEMAENLRHNPLDVTLIEYADHLLAPLDADMAAAVHTEMKANGVHLLLKTAVTALEADKDGILVRTSADTIPTDMVLLCVGVTPDTALAAAAGLKLGIRNSIAVNAQMQTSVPDIYAVGDAVQVRHFVSGEDALVSLAGPANKQARIAADNICGHPASYDGAQGSSVIKVFDMTVATTGIKEEQAARLGLPYDKVVLSPMSHASYYPGGRVMTIKLLFRTDTQQILGAQILGYEGVDKRIDVLATAIRAGMKVTSLCELELSYAPPYSSAKDPVNMAGYIAENLLSGMVKQFHYEDLPALLQNKDVFLLDTRTPAEYAKGHVEGFANIPLDELRERLQELPAGRPVYVMCQSGLRSYLACRILAGNGMDCYNFSGGYRFYDILRKGGALPTEAYPCGMNR